MAAPTLEGDRMRADIPAAALELVAKPGAFPEHDVPHFHTAAARLRLVRRYGLPNSYPAAGERLFGDCRVLFVDDHDGGRPVAYWSRKR